LWQLPLSPVRTLGGGDPFWRCNRYPAIGLPIAETPDQDNRPRIRRPPFLNMAENMFMRKLVSILFPFTRCQRYNLPMDWLRFFGCLLAVIVVGNYIWWIFLSDD